MSWMQFRKMDGNPIFIRRDQIVWFHADQYEGEEITVLGTADGQEIAVKHHLGFVLYHLTKQVEIPAENEVPEP